MKHPFLDNVKSKIPSFIRHDFLRKLFAFLFTLLLFLYVRNSEDGKPKTSDVKIRNVNVQLELPPDVVYPTKTSPDFHVTLEVSGPEYYLEKNPLSADDFKIEIKAGKDNVKNGNQLNVEVLPKDVEIKKKPLFGGKIIVKDIAPDKIVLYVDPIVTKKVPIKIQYSEQDIPEGYSLEKIPLPKDKDKVTITGPASILDSIKKVDTMPVPLKDVTGDFTIQTSLQSIHSDVKLIPDTVTVTGRISDYEKRSFVDVPVQVLLSYPFDFKKIEKFTLEPKTVNIEFSEPRRADPLGRVLLSAFHPMVDVAGLDAESGAVKRDIQLRCDNPEVKNMRVTPATVTVTVKPADKEGTEAPNKEIAK